jgi:hypothetical protein
MLFEPVTQSTSNDGIHRYSRQQRFDLGSLPRLGDGDDSAIVTALPEEQLMPLSRLNDGFEIELQGIAFGMVDRQGHRWRCLITDRVLSDAIGGAPNQNDKTVWFRANRSSVERVASNKFDMGAFDTDGFISITHWRRRG